MIRPYPGSSDRPARIGSGSFRMIWPTFRSSGSSSLTINRPKSVGALTSSHSFLAPPPLSSPILRAATWRFDQGFVKLSSPLISHTSEDPESIRNFLDLRRKLKGISFKILLPRSLNVASSRRFPPVNHLLYLSRGHA